MLGVDGVDGGVEEGGFEDVELELAGEVGEVVADGGAAGIVDGCSGDKNRAWCCSPVVGQRGAVDEMVKLLRGGSGRLFIQPGKSEMELRTLADSF